jgi:hypothetical protein
MSYPPVDFTSGLCPKARHRRRGMNALAILALMLSGFCIGFFCAGLVGFRVKKSGTNEN